MLTIMFLASKINIKLSDSIGKSNNYNNLYAKDYINVFVYGQ